MNHKAKPPRTIADMALLLADKVPELSDDELCRATLRNAGVPPFYAKRWRTARELARHARGAEADLRSLTRWK